MVAHAGTAAGWANDGPRFQKGLDESFSQGLQVDLARRGNDQQAHAGRDLLACENPGRGLQVGQAAVGACADKGLLDGRARGLGQRGHVVHPMRPGYDRTHRAHVHFDDARVGGARVGEERAFLQVGAGFPFGDAQAPGQPRRKPGEGRLVGWDVRVLGAHLRHHVRQHHALLHREGGDPITRELDRLIERAIRAQRADEGQGQVFGRNTVGQTSVEHDAQAFGHAQPDTPQRPERGHLAASHPRGERAHPALVRGVAVRAQDHLAGQDERVFRDQLVADAFAHIEEVADALLVHERAHVRVVLRVAHRGRGGGVIQGDDQALGVVNAHRAHVLEDAQDGGGVVVGEQAVGCDFDDFTHRDVAAARSASDGLLGEGSG